MKREKYLKQNRIVNKLARELNVEFVKQFSYRGPCVTRTKLWFLGYRNATGRVNKLLRELNKLKFVEYAIYVGHITNKAQYSSPDNIYVRYK